MTEERRNKRRKRQSGVIAVMITLMVLMFLSTALLFLPEEKPKSKNHGNTTGSVTPTAAITPISAEEEVLAVL